MAASLWLNADKDEYHADTSISQSSLKVFLRDPQQFYRQFVARTEPRKPPTASMVFGNQVEDFAFRNRLNAVMIPSDVLNEKGDRRDRAGERQWSSWKLQQQAAHGEDVQLLKADEFGKPFGPGAVMQSVDSLRGHDFANELIWGPSLKNVRIRWVDEITGLPCRCEIDILHAEAIIGDLKTTNDPSESGFAKSVSNFGYHIQAFFYREALHRLAEFLDDQQTSPELEFLRPLLEQVQAGKPLLCTWIAVKNSPSYMTEVHPVDEDWYSIAEPLVREAMQKLKESYASGNWQTPTHGGITRLKPPKWAFNALEALSDEE